MSVYTYDDLVAENHRLKMTIAELREAISSLEREVDEYLEREVECQFCGRDVAESRAVSPVGQGIWFCLVCDDELTRDRAKYLLKTNEKNPKQATKGESE